MNKKLVYLVVALAVLAVALFLITRNTASTINKDLYNFAVEDTAAVQKLFIADHFGNSVWLEKEDGKWYLGKNKLVKANKYTVSMALKTLGNLSIKSPVKRSGIPKYLELLASNHKKVEVYSSDLNQPDKVIFIGMPSKDHMGNLALLELPGQARSEIPYYIQDDKKQGFISPVFTLNERDWISTELFRSKPEDVEFVEVHFPENQNESFRIYRSNPEDEWKVKSLYGPGAEMEPDQFFASLYIDNFKSVYYEVDAHKLSAAQKDSVAAQEAMATIKLKEFDGKEVSLKAIALMQEVVTQEDDTLIQRNLDRYYGYLNNHKLILCQYFNTDKLFIKRSEILPKESPVD